mgnify:CR=1 FL=1
MICFSYLEDETTHFLQLEPSLEDVLLVSFEEIGISVESRIELEITLQNQKFRLLAEVGSELKERNEIAVSFFKVNTTENTAELVSARFLTDEVKQELHRVYHHFQEVIANMPKFRLYFITSEIEFYIENDDWF